MLKIPWIVAGLILAPVLCRTAADPDLWGHVRFGLDMIETRSLPSDDPYSFTQDIPWINHEWLSELIMASAYKTGGTAALVLVRVTLIGIFAALIVTTYVNAPAPVAGVVFILVAWGTQYLTATLRPQLWTLVGVAILSRLLTTPPSRWWLVAIPLLFSAWVNVHGGWIVGAGLLAVWTAFNIVWLREHRLLIAATALSSAFATLINPYGWHMWRFLGETVRMSREISEWQPLFTLSAWEWLPWVFALGAIIALQFSPYRPSLDRVAMCVMLAYASLRVARIAPLFVAATAMLMRHSILTWGGRTAVAVAAPSRAGRIVLVTVLSLLAIISGTLVTRALSCITLSGHDWTPDRAAGRTLAESALRGTIVTWFDWGQYALWHFGPQLRVSIDGRRETIYSDRVLSAHYAMYGGRPEGIAYLQQLNPDYVWLPARLTRVRDWLVANGYRLDIQTQASFIAVRADKPVVHAGGEPIGNCFPGP